MFNHDDSDAILLEDSANGFSSLNCSITLYNIQQLYPPLACVLINTYRSPASLSVSGDAILSGYADVYYCDDSADPPSYQ